MRHRKSGKKLGRKAAHRKALMANLAMALIFNKKIKTTDPKAKELRSFIEPLITRAKKGDVHSRRLDYKYIAHKPPVREHFNVIAPTLDFAKNQCQLFLNDPANPKSGDDWEVFDVEITDLEEVKGRIYQPPVMNGGNSETVVAALPDVDEDFKKAFEAKDEEDKKHYFKIIEDSEGNVIGQEEIFPDAPAKPAKKSKSKKK